MLPRSRASSPRTETKPGGWLVLGYVLLALVALLSLFGAWLSVGAGSDWAGLGHLAVAVLCVALGFMVLRNQRRDARRVLALLDLSEGLWEKVELDDLVADIGRIASRLVPHAEGCILHLLDESNRRLLPRYSSQPGSELPLGIPADKGIAGQALRTLRTVTVADVRSDPRFLPLHSAPELRSLLVAPLHHEGLLVGTLSLNSAAIGAFSPRDELLVRDLAGRASVAIRHSLRYAAAKSEVRGLESVINSLSDGLVVLDGEGRVVRYNPSLAHILGAEVSDIVGRKVEAGSNIEGLRRLAAMLGDISRGAKRGYEREVEVEEPIRALLRIQVSPLLDPDGSWGHLVVLHDRTDELSRIRSRSSLLAAASREMRPALESIRGYVTLLVSHELAEDSRVRSWALRIREQSARLSRFAEDLADLCAEDSEGLTIGTELVSVGELLSDTVGELDQAAQRKEVSVEIQCPPDLPDLPLDRDRVRHVLLNLLENAIHRAAAKGRIALKAEANLEELTIALADDGAPVPAEERARAFQGLYLADESGPVGPGGTGLGLYISRKIIEAHGGHLWMPESEEGEVTFRFILPLGDFPGGESPS